MIKIGSNSVNAIYLGLSAVDRLYYNGEMIWPEGGLTYFVLADGSVIKCLVKGQLLSTDVPAGVVSAYIGERVTGISAHGFLNQTELSGIYIPDNVRLFGSSSFENCFALTSIRIPSAVPALYRSTFAHCSSLVSVDMPDSITTIHANVFNGCASLSSIDLPDELTSLGDASFAGCTGLTGITIPDSVSHIGNYALSGCSSLSDVVIGNSVTSIGEYAFFCCRNLSSVNIPDGVPEIGLNMFAGCWNLPDIALPNSVSSIGEWAFNECTSLTAIDFGNERDSVPQLVSTTAFWRLPSDYVIIVPDAMYDTWIDATNWSDDSVKPHIVKWSGRTIVKYTAASGLPDWERDIVGELAYDSIPNKSHIVEVEIGSHVTSLGNGAFSGCSGLKSVTIPDSVTSIGGCAFSWCISLTSVTIPDSVRSIGREAFDRCSRLMSVTIGNSVTSIKWSTFSRCSGLTSVTIPDSVTSIEDGAFKGSNNIEVFDFGNTRSTIPQLANTNAFMDLGEDYKIVVPDALYENWSLSSTNWRDDSIRPHIKKWSEYQPLQFTAVDAGATIAFNKVGSPDDARIVTSTDGQAWTPYTFNDVITLANAGDKVYFRAADENDISFYTDDSNYYRFATTYKKKIAASGNIQTLMKADGSRLDISGKGNCYQSIFQYCSSLTTAPELIATTIADNCYYYMFNGCTSLTAAPALPATTLANNCYTYMFKGCSSLASAPALPATTLAYGCYYSMFQNCSSLTTAPELPAMSLVHSCYSNMFSGCSSLTGNTTVSLAQTSAIPNNALYQTFSQTTGQTQLTFILDLSDFTTIPQLPNADTISVFDSASDTRLTIKVPASLLTTWKDSSNWSNFADRIIAAA